jgi:hypothetical protein
VLGPERGNLPSTLPKLDVVAIHQLLGALFGAFVICTE